MADGSPHPLDPLLGGGDPSELVDRLVPHVYEELRHLARAQRRRTGSPDTVDTTALVHEAYLRLSGRELVPDRAYFFAAAARAMRNVLLDHARFRRRRPRGRGITLNLAVHDDPAGREVQAAELIDIDAALGRLAELDARAAQVVECRFFGGLSIEETAEAVGAGTATVKRDWRRARAWLLTQLGPSAPSLEA